MKTSSNLSKPLLIVISGPTAVGKTSLSIELAQDLDAEIISSDSRQFFKELNIGTAKPSLKELQTVPHHFINNKSIKEEYNASLYEKEALSFLDQYFKRKNTALLVGGSGMYIDALLQGFDDKLPSADPKLRKELNELLEKKGLIALQEMLKIEDPVFYQEVDLNNPKRILRALEVCLICHQPYSSLRKGKKQLRPFNIVKVGIERSREELYQRINLRVDQMIAEGLEQEVKSLTSFKHHNALKTVGYKEWWPYLDGHIGKDEVLEKIKVNSRRYAKRQITWFKRDDEITWFSPSNKLELLTYIRNTHKQGE